MRAVVDAGPVIHLSWIDRLDLLDQLFDEVFIPPAVLGELLAAPADMLGLDRIQRALAGGRLNTQAPTAVVAPATGGRGRGEVEAIALAEELGVDLFISDDMPARRAAQERGIAVTGTIGLLKLARQEGLLPAALPLVLELRRRGQWISDALIEAVSQEESDAEMAEG